MMNLVCLTRITPFHDVKGGMENHQKTLAEGLVARGHDVTVITTGLTSGETEKVVNGVRYLFTKSKPGVYSRSWNKHSAEIVRSLHNQQTIDLIWAEAGGAFGIFRLLQQMEIPYVPISQGTIPGDLISYARQMRSLTDVAKFVIRGIQKTIWFLRDDRPYHQKAAAIIAVSHELKAEIMRFYAVPSDLVTVIFNGVAISLFRQDATLRNQARQTYNIPADAHVLLGMGRIIREKGHHVTLQAFDTLSTQHPNLYLIIAGKGPFLDELKKRAAGLAGAKRIIFPGFVTYEQTAELYNAADIFVAPTLRSEGLPLTFCEAMLCGVPVVASSYGGNPSAVHHEKTGLLLSAVTVDKLVRQLERLLTDQKLLTQISQNAKKFAEKEFTQEEMVSKTEQLFEEIVSTRNSKTT
jgi:glycosyltransferase involved in cell wall biosynthesis